MILRLIAGILGIYATYSLITGYQAGYWGYVVSGVVSLVAAVALWMKKTWSQYLVYLIAVLFTGSWIWIVWRTWEQGWPYKGLLQSVISLVPGILMISVALGSIVIVYRTFRRRER